jgi:hypothetical protein
MKNNIFILIFLFSFLSHSFVWASNPDVPIIPDDNIQDPGDLGTAWGGCGPSDPNCYVTGYYFNGTLSGFSHAEATNTINNTNYLQEWQWNTLAGTSGLKLSSTSTLATGNAQKLFEVSLSGANDNATQTTYGGYFSNTHTGATSTNVGLYATASGGTTNYAAEMDGILRLDNLSIRNIGTRSLAINTLSTFSTGTDSFYFGSSVGSNIDSSDNAILMGGSAGSNSDNVNNSIFLGNVAGFSAGDAVVSSSTNSIGLGSSACLRHSSATVADYAICIGFAAGEFLRNSPDVILIGYQAGDGGSLYVPSTSPAGSHFHLLMGPDTKAALLRDGGAIGRGATNTASNQFVMGSSTANSYIDSIFFGSGVTATAPVDYVINGSGASGTDIGGGDVTLASGKATGNAVGGSILFQTSNAGASGATLQSLTTKMIILASGFVGISNTNPAVALHVGSSSTTDGTTLLRLEDANSTCNFTADAGAPTCGSDRRLKTDIEDLDTNDILEKLVSLDTVSYHWKTDDTDSPLQYGFIAQNVQEYFPNLVKEGEWIDGSQKLFLSMGGLMPYAVASIKELNLKLNDIQDFEDEDSNFRGRFIAWLGNASNKITRIFTGEICLYEEGYETECLNKEDAQKLKNLLAEA